MSAVTLALVQSLVPVPPSPPLVLDHRITCNLFGTEAALGRVSVETVAESAALARLTMRGKVDGLALPPLNASALSERGTVAVQSSGRGIDYHWTFRVPTAPVSRDGVVEVVARAGAGPIRYVATGICMVTSSKAAYQ